MTAVAVGLILGLYASASGTLTPLEFGVFTFFLMIPFGIIIAARLMGSLRKLLVVTLLGDLALGIDLHLFYQQSAADLSGIGGLNISIVTLSLVALYGWWVLEQFTGRAHLPIRELLRTSKPLAFHLGFVLLSLAVAQSWLLASFEINLVLQGLLLYIFAVHFIQSREDLLFIVTILILGLGMQGTIMVLLKATGGTVDFGIISAEPDPFGRLSGTVGGPNQSASFLVMWMAMTFGFMLTPVRFYLKLIGVAAVFMALPALLFTFSRGGWVAFTIAVIITGTVAWRRGWMPFHVIVTLALLAVALAIPIWPYVMARIFGDDGGAAEARLPLMKIALLIIRDHPILGVGPNNYALVIPDYLTSEFSSAWIRVVHNRFLMVWAESGLGALLTLLWLLADSLYRAWQIVKLDDPLLSPLALGLGAAICGWLFHMQVAVFHDSIQVLTLCLSTGLIYALHRLARIEYEDSPDRV